MNFFTKLFSSLFNSNSLKNITQAQNEALLDCISLAIVVDGSADDVELKQVQRTVNMMKWQGDVSPDSYVKSSLDNARNIFVEESEMRVFASDIAERLDLEWLREEAYYVSALIVTADNELGEEERIFLQSLQESFGIPPRRMAEITESLIQDMKF